MPGQMVGHPSLCFLLFLPVPSRRLHHPVYRLLGADTRFLHDVRNAHSFIVEPLHGSSLCGVVSAVTARGHAGFTDYLHQRGLADGSISRNLAQWPSVRILLHYDFLLPVRDSLSHPTVSLIPRPRRSPEAGKHLFTLYDFY